MSTIDPRTHNLGHENRAHARDRSIHDAPNLIVQACSTCGAENSQIRARHAMRSTCRSVRVKKAGKYRIPLEHRSKRDDMSAGLETSSSHARHKAHRLGEHSRSARAARRDAYGRASVESTSPRTVPAHGSGRPATTATSWTRVHGAPHASRVRATRMERAGAGGTCAEAWSARAGPRKALPKRPETPRDLRMRFSLRILRISA
jgi:hypothetical protein